MAGPLVAVDAGTLNDLLALVDDLLGRSLPDPILEIANIRAVPLANISALRGAVSELRCHNLAPV